MRRARLSLPLVLALASACSARDLTHLRDQNGATADGGASEGDGTDDPRDPTEPGSSGGNDPSTPGSQADGGTAPATAPGYLHTSGSKIVDEKGNAVRLTGLSWFGMETTNYAPHGLWARGLGSMLDQIKTLGYNMIRIPFTNQMLDSGSMPNGIDYGKNADLQGLTAIQLLDKIVLGAASRGLRVVLDRHRPEASGQSELWYTQTTPEKKWIDDWKMLAARYKGKPAVVGFDLHNEPHGAATWGDGAEATDWRLAAERAGAAILAVNPDVLIIVEGVEKNDGKSYWWGGNLRGAKAAPVRLPVAGRLVYSPHEYPSSVFAQAWFSDPSYPQNMPGVWDATWGYLVKENIAPVWVGEFGTKYETAADKTWLTSLTNYIGEQKVSFAYWCLNPNSGDTGGILMDDWQTVRTDKQSVVTKILAPAIP